MPTCPNGHAVTEGQKFCPECGSTIELGNEGGPILPESPTKEAQRSGRSSLPSYVIPLVAGGIILIAVLGWFAVSDGGSGPLAEKHDIQGTLTASECGGGYDIENASVDVRDQDDKLIGSSTTSLDTGATEFGCTVEFTVLDVPKASFYQVTIGTHGGPSYSYSEMKSNGWELDLSLD